MKFSAHEDVNKMFAHVKYQESINCNIFIFGRFWKLTMTYLNSETDAIRVFVRKSGIPKLISLTLMLFKLCL